MQRLTAKEQTENIENRPVVLKERHGTLLKETTRQSLLTKTIKLKRGVGGRQHISVQNCFLKYYTKQAKHTTTSFTYTVTHTYLPGP